MFKYTYIYKFMYLRYVMYEKNKSCKFCNSYALKIFSHKVQLIHTKLYFSMMSQGFLPFLIITRISRYLVYWFSSYYIRSIYSNKYVFEIVYNA